MRVSRGITWIVGLSPVAVIPGAALALFAMFKDGRGWIGILPAGLALGCIMTGLFGGMALAIKRVEPWWLVVSLASLGIGFLALQAAAAIALGHMH